MALRASSPSVLALAAAFAAASACEPRVDPNAHDVPVVDSADTTAPGDDVADADADLPVDVPIVTDVPTAACTPDHDGTITRAEISVMVGATELFAVNTAATTVTGVNTAGTTGASGRVWDFSMARPEDHRVLEEVLAPAGQWWAAQYPTATYATPVDLANTVLGVYRVSSARVELLATVSREANRTNLAMNPAVIVVQFPLTEGATWSQTVNAAGTYNFTPLVNVTQYTFTVDARGEVWTPAGRFPALRLRMDLDQSIPGTLIRRTQRTYTFLSECWGYVARIASSDNETAVDFTTAAEYRRLSL